MLILTAEDVKKSLPFDETIKAMKQAYSALTSGKAEVPLRTQLNIPSSEGMSLFMPSFVQDENEGSLILKAVTVFPHNVDTHIPTIHAAVIVFDPRNGEISALLEGGTLTAIRTGAASGAATDILARKEARNLAIFGTGVQGRTQIEAICTVRKIETVWVYDIKEDRAHTFAEELGGKGKIPINIKVAKNPKEAIREADIVCTATTSSTPVYNARDIKPGTHINGIGSYTLEMIENPPELFKIALPFVDSVKAVMAEAGEIVAAIQRDLLVPDELIELGEVILKQQPGRTNEEQITYFKSVGIAVQDALAARLALQNAQKMGLGQQVHW